MMTADFRRGWLSGSSGWPGPSLLALMAEVVWFWWWGAAVRDELLFRLQRDYGSCIAALF